MFLEKNKAIAMTSNLTERHLTQPPSQVHTSVPCNHIMQRSTNEFPTQSHTAMGNRNSHNKSRKFLGQGRQ